MKNKIEIEAPDVEVVAEVVKDVVLETVKLPFKVAEGLFNWITGNDD